MFSKGVKENCLVLIHFFTLKSMGFSLSQELSIHMRSFEKSHPLRKFALLRGSQTHPLNSHESFMRVTSRGFDAVSGIVWYLFLRFETR